jgi:hypothetical protein
MCSRSRVAGVGTKTAVLETSTEQIGSCPSKLSFASTKAG